MMLQCEKCLTQTPEKKKLLRCGGCRLVYYCNSDCQKKDRSNHRLVCRKSIFPSYTQILTEAVSKSSQEKSLMFSNQEHCAQVAKCLISSFEIYQDLGKTKPQLLNAFLNYLSQPFRMLTHRDSAFGFGLMFHLQGANYYATLPYNSVLFDSLKSKEIQYFYDVGCGRALWFSVLATYYASLHYPVEFFGYDVEKNKHKPDEKVKEIVYSDKGISAFGSQMKKMEEKVKSKSILFLLWPPFDTLMALNALAKWEGKFLLYSGEMRGGCCAEDGFFEELASNWKQIEHHPQPHHIGITSFSGLYVRSQKQQVTTSTENTSTEKTHPPTDSI